MERRRTLGSEVMEMGKEWKLVKEETISEEQRTISVEFAEGYEELDILILSCAAKTANDNISNRNAVLSFFSSKGEKLMAYIQNFIFKDGLNRIMHASCKCIPYFWFEYGIMNASNTESSATASYIQNLGAGFNRKFGDNIKSLTLQGQQGVFGVGTTIIIYGR